MAARIAGAGEGRGEATQNELLREDAIRPLREAVEGHALRRAIELPPPAASHHYDRQNFRLRGAPLVVPLQSTPDRDLRFFPIVKAASLFN
ncbi:hypothetical protein BU26DRAFT_564511 [Trematosphaeria pertusa]|uniref:Uncharacterized protein n=1 Tax=Trematosphaeria pertusa TaxID=390896 RepID=A0A6A6IGY8_9PLEO|nr:uncharacterized protein BU26DRAFT_564511 [Trematosphaeria pertusa]KAF2248820.1 hypothetical protein BU26DRAFT_564511 [Trematosphaeria pertusa]